MSNLKSWSIGIKRRIEAQKEQFYRSDYKFFKVDRLEKIAERLDEFSENCARCENLKSETEDIVERLPEYINGSPRQRKAYEKRNDALAEHLRKEHKLYPHNYFMSVYSLAGFAAGIILAGSLSLLFFPELLFHALIVGFLLGLFAGYFYGAKIDKQQKKQNLIL
jgi:hypothetical protein